MERPERSFEERAYRAARRMSGEILSGDLDPEDLARLVTEIGVLAEKLAADVRMHSPLERPIACRAGCGHCCHMSVAAAPVEIFRLAHHIRRRFAATAREQLIERLRSAAAMTRDARVAAGLPCPLLEHDSCSAYAARPLNCMGLESMDADACRRASFAEIPSVPIDMARWTLFSRVLGGLVAGTADAGRGREQLDLFPALLIALEREDAAWRWLRGEALFEECLWLPTYPSCRRGSFVRPSAPIFQTE